MFVWSTRYSRCSCLCLPCPAHIKDCISEFNLVSMFLVSRSCWCALACHQMSLCVEQTCLLLVPCAPMSIVCLLPSCYLIIVSVAPPVSPSLPSFVSLFVLLVSVVLCWSVVFRRVCVMLTAQQFSDSCFSPSGWVLLLFVLFYY